MYTALISLSTLNFRLSAETYSQPAKRETLALSSYFKRTEARLCLVLLDEHLGGVFVFLEAAQMAVLAVFAPSE